MRGDDRVIEFLNEQLTAELTAINQYFLHGKMQESSGDVTSANIFEGILSDEEEHIDYLETQQGLISQLGEQLYLAQLVEQPDD